MFVGEMGCWLVVGILAIWRRCGPASADGGYQAVETTDNADGADGGVGDDASIRSNTVLNGSGRVADAYSDNKSGASILRGWRVLLLSLPAIFDILGTTLMNAGLLLVAASIYQMTRGALVLFVGLFSVVFLRRHLHLFQWLSLVGVVLGVAIVGLAGAIYPDKKGSPPVVGPVPPGGDTHDADITVDALRVMVGVLLIAFAQVFTATQFVLEEWILERSSIEPIEVVGWEGTFGLLVTVLIMVTLHFAVGTGYFDMVEGWRQMTENKVVWVTSLLIMVSIG